MKFRLAHLDDAIHISQLIRPHIDQFAANPNGEHKFSIDAIQVLLSDAKVQYWLLEHDSILLGVIAYREPAHLVHYFVAEQYQGLGLGRRMWDFIEEKLKVLAVTVSVNSSEYAVPIYQQLGFTILSEVIEAYDLRYVKMQKELYTA